MNSDSISFTLQDATEAKAPPGVELIQGTPDEALAEYGLQLRASLLVMGSLGRRSLSDWLLGRTAERLVRGSSLPNLVVRRPQPFLDWLGGAKKLRVMWPSVRMARRNRPCCG